MPGNAVGCVESSLEVLNVTVVSCRVAPAGDVSDCRDGLPVEADLGGPSGPPLVGGGVEN